MATLFTTIYDRFLDKVTDDMYLELTPEDTIKDLRRLLIDALPGFEYPRVNLYNYTIETEEMDESDVQPSDFVLRLIWHEMDEETGGDACHPDRDPDDIPVSPSQPRAQIEKSKFNVDLTEEEINIIVILMMINWVQRQVTSIENTRMKYSGSDFKMTSQANHLAKLLSLLSESQRQSHHMQRLYKRREHTPGTGTYRSTWYWFGDNNATE